MGLGSWRSAACLLVVSTLLAAPAVASADSAGLVAQWHLDTVTGGATPDSSGNGLTGDEVTGTLIPGGRFASALATANPNDGFRVLANPLIEPQRITVMAWVKKGPPVPNNVFRTIVSKGSDSCGTHESYALDTGPDGGLRFFAYQGASGAAVVAGAVAPASIWNNQWHAVAGTFDGTTVRLYVDGAQVGSAPAATPGGGIQYGLQENRLGVGRFPQGAPCDPNGFQFVGAIDEVRLYNRALTPAEVSYVQRADATTPPSLPIPGGGGGGGGGGGPVPNLRIVSTGGGSAYQCLPSGALDHTVSFSWWRLSDIATIDPRTGVHSNQSVKVASGATLVIPPSQRGHKFYCEVDDAGLHLSSAGEVLSGLKNIPAIRLKPAYGNFRARGIDIFQTVQPSAGAQTFGFNPSAPLTSIPFATYCGGGTPTSYRQTGNAAAPCASVGAPQRVAYSGVRFDERKPATAVVYVDMVSGVASDPAQPLEVTLNALVGGQVLSKGLTATITNPPLAATPFVTPAERGAPGFGVRFSVPASWLAVAVLSGEHHLDLQASVSLPVGAAAGSARECDGGTTSGCAADDSFRLDGVPVYDDLPDLTIRSLPLLDGNQTLTPPDQVIAKALQVYPGGERFSVLPYDGSVDITSAAARSYADPACTPYRTSAPAGETGPQQAARISADTRTCRQAGVNQALDEWWKSDTANRSGYNLLMAVHSYPLSPGSNNEPGWTRGGTTITTPGQMPTIAINQGDLGRPLTAAAHEFGHAMGLLHADLTCGGNAGGQIAEPWPPDNAGRLQGTAAIPGSRRIRNSIVPTTNYNTDGAPNALYDLMSYCAPENGAWLSGRNWNHVFYVLEQKAASLTSVADQAGRRAQTAGPAPALVIGSLGAGGAQIDRVMPAGSGNLPDPPDSASPIRLRSFTAAGKLLAESGVRLNQIGHRPAYVFAAGAPGSAAKIELVSAGKVLATKQRSRPPTVRLTAPRHRSTVGKRLRVSWIARDPDHDPLMASVDYSSDGGRLWRHVLRGPSTGRASIPGQYLESSDRGRVRVVVNDGFSDATALSAVLRAPGTAPSARIVLPQAGVALQAGRVRLFGAARDDHTHRLRGRALTWFAGSRRLGSGEQLRAQLPAGRVTLRLVARDSRRHVAVVTRRLVVAPVTLRLLRLQTPSHVGPRAHTLAIGLATSVPATLRVGSHHYSVGPHSRTVRIPLPARPKIGIIQFTVTISATGARQAALRERIVLLRA